VSGRPVELIVCVRRFFCQESTCVRKIFAERFPSLTLPRVKFTRRLQETLRQMGFALGGEAGARLGRQLSIPGSSDTLLRLVKGADLSVASSPRVVEVVRAGRRAQKLDRYTQVIELHHQGLRAAEIASRIGIGERTVHRWVAHGSFPEARQRRRRPSLIDPYERYVLSRWQEGNQNGSQLYKELTAQGYKGSPKAMYNAPFDPADTSIRRTKIDSIEAAKTQEHSLVTCPSGKLLCTACYLVVCLSTRAAGRDEP
jgi:hypothetical protein